MYLSKWFNRAMFDSYAAYFLNKNILFYALLCIVSPNENATTGSKLRYKIYFTQETENCFPFHMNTKNKFLMSKWRIQRTLIKSALEIC